MQTTVEERPDSRVSVSAEVPPEDVQKGVNRAARSLALNRMLVLGSCGIAATMALLTLGVWVDDFYYYIAIMIAYALANGFVYPTSISGAISVDPGIAGAASAFLGPQRSHPTVSQAK